MLPPNLAALYQSLSSLPAPHSDAQSALIEELRGLAGGEPPAPPATLGTRSLGPVLDVCPTCSRPFGGS